MIVHAVLVKGESITPGSWAIAFDLLGSVFAQAIIVLATVQEPAEISRFFSRSMSSGYPHAFLAWAGDRDLKAASQAVVKDVKKNK